MNPIVFALRHPYTVMVGLLALILGSVLAVQRMKVDIFPSLNLPVIYVAQPYGGLDPAQMEGLITNYYEYHFLYVNGIHHVESKNVQGVALMKLFFHPGTNMAQAMAETIQYVNRSRAFMPPGTVGPFVMRFDTGSVPVGFLVLSSKTMTIKDIQDQALFKVRPMFASLPGVSAPPPFGGNQRTIVVSVDPNRLRSYNLSPDDVVAALNLGNTISPSGNVRILDQMPIVPVNAMVKDPKELGSIPLRPGENIYLRDLATIEDASDIPSGYALVDGRRAVYILVTKRADASTLDVVNAVKANLPKMRDVLYPQDIDVHFEFDQSPYVTRAMWGVSTEGLLGAFLTGLMVLLFLRDWRSVVVVVLNIPFALLGAVVALWLSGQTINLMTLGGLALAVGILVDESTVEVENIHTQFEYTPSIARAVRRGNSETAVPRLLAMLCVLAVFIPSFFMEGAARELFVPLSLAVGFAMIASYLLSSTFVPVASVWLLRHYHPGHAADGWLSFGRFRSGYGRLVRRIMSVRWLLVGGYCVAAALLIWLVGGQLGREIFPTVDSGQFQLRLRAPDGTRIERTEEIAQQALEIIKDEAGRNSAGESNVAISLGYVGLVPSSYPINNIFLWTRGPEEAVLRVQFKPGTVRVEELKHRLREQLPRRLGDWLRAKLLAENFSEQRAAERVQALKFSFEPADIINEVMSFGSPTPIEIAISGPKFADNRAYAERVREELSKIPSLRDLQYAQSLDYPAVSVAIDRERAGLSGVTASDISRSLVAATSSSRFVVPIFWADPNTGIGYQVQVQIPIEQMNSADEIGLVPIKRDTDKSLLVRDVADVREQKVQGEYDRYNMRRLVSMTANIEGEDLGRVASQISRALLTTNESLWVPHQQGEKRGWKNTFSGEFEEGAARPAKPPRALQIDVRGQVVPMQQMFGALAGGKIFEGLTLGLGLAVVVIFLLLTAYFQSIRLAIASVTAVPAAIAGVALMLLVTGTTLNIQSFMGSIMAIGVAVANAILLITFAERGRLEGATPTDAAGDAARHRLRPILMTSCAMIAGMLPMALGLGEGGEQVAPLGRAVIGGLALATVATLLVLPSVFAVVQWGSKVQSVSLDPDDPESVYCDRQPETHP
jgi:multidrug efflux pump subunit AcrB